MSVIVESPTLNIFRGNLRNNCGYSYNTRFIDPREPFPYIRSHMDLRNAAIKKNNLKIFSTHGSSGGPFMSGGGQHGSGLTKTLLSMGDQYLMNSSDRYRIIRQAMQLAQDTGELLYDAYGSELATEIKNSVARHYDKNPLARPAFAGEKMIFIPTNYGLSQANFCGGNVRLRERMERGDKGVDGPGGIDEQCGRYKIKEANAITPDQKKEALNQFIDNLDKAKGSSKVKSLLKAFYKSKRMKQSLGLDDEDIGVNMSNIRDDDADDKEFMNQLELKGGKYKIKKKKKRVPGSSLKKKLHKLYG